ncbi:hypothetical protein [Candidatus Aquiluna sp. UB-MaderosW2red]|uniref:hypothetical protein n=1 Tax=Candidatus Aquiluna sp. UB-MaderosW2red TaxID=1855377 RepID=UPI0012F7983F|nr:hypothetical protein [Candidatus Aquiluna sp. UB-MaderosW2red]
MRSIARYTRKLYERQVTSQPFRLEAGEQRDRDRLSRRPSPVRDASDSLSVRIRLVPHKALLRADFQLETDACRGSACSTVLAQQPRQPQSEVAPW